MMFRHAVEFPHVALGLIAEILNSIDVVLFVCKQRQVINP